MDHVTIDATADEFSLLKLLWEMASASHALVEPGVLPGRAVTCHWSEIHRLWRQTPPALDDLQSVRKTLTALTERDIRIDGAPPDYVGEKIVSIQMLSRDPAGTQDVCLLINLSGYTPLVLKNPATQ